MEAKLSSVNSQLEPRLTVLCNFFAYLSCKFACFLFFCYVAINKYFLCQEMCFSFSRLKPAHTMCWNRGNCIKKLPFNFSLFVYASNPPLTLSCRSNLILSYVLWTFLLPTSPILSLSPMSPPMQNNSWTHPPCTLFSISVLLLLLLLFLIISWCLSELSRW